MGTIFCLIGKSASGKDTLYQALLHKKELRLRRVVPYTTRPMRAGETDGETYFFRTEEEARRLEEEGRIIEMRAYATVHGIWKYFTADDGQICLEESDYLLIGTLEAYEMLRGFFGTGRVCPLYLWVDDGVRLERALMRERAQSAPKYAEMCRRFLADEEDFSEEKLHSAGIRMRFENREEAETVREISRYIAAVQKAGPIHKEEGQLSAAAHPGRN